VKPHVARLLCTRPCEGKTPYPQGTGRGLPLGARRHVAGLPPSLPSCDGAFVLSQLSDYLFGLAAAVAWSQSCQQSDHPFHVQPSLPCRCPASHSPLVDSPTHSPSGCDISDQDGLTRLVFLRDLCAIGERVDGASASAMTLANKAQRHAWPSKWRKLSMSGLPYISLRIKNSKQRAISEEPRKTTASRE
jgi:hypothetical protein